MAASNKKSAIHVLHVDDDSSIQDITKLMLLELDSSIEIDNACCVDEALKKLTSKKYDVVVSDYEMPQKDGLQFLVELRKLYNKTPFILFTGKGREEVAIKALNLGADGYFNKQGSPETVYGELVHGIRNIVNRKISEERLKESEFFNQKILNSTPNFIYIYDLAEHRNVFANKEIIDFLGYTPEQAKSMGSELFANILHPEDAEAVAKHHANFLNAQFDEIFEIEYRMKNLKGEWRWLHSQDTLFSQTPEGVGKQILGVSEDVTQSREIKIALKLSEEKYRAYTENSPVAFFVVNSEGKYIQVNDAAGKLLSYSRNELLEMNIVDLLFEKDVSNGIKQFSLLKETGKALFEIPLKRKDGQQVYVILNAVRLPDGNLMAFCENITERKKAEDQLEKSEVRYRELADFLPEIVFEADIEGKINYFNKRAFEITGFTSEELEKGLNIFSFVVSEEREKAARNAKKTLTRQEHEASEYRLFKKDGSTYPAIVRTSPIFSEGKVTGLRGIAIDISERKKIEKKNQLLASIVESSDDAIISKSLDGIITSWNRGAEKIYGYTAEEVAGKSIQILTPLDRKNEILQILKRIGAGEQLRHFETIRVRKDGLEIDVSLTVSPIKNEVGLIVGASTVARDISERKKNEIRLKQYNEILERVGDSIDVGLAVIDKDYRVVWANKRLMDLGVSPNKKCYETFNNLGIVCPDCGIEKIFNHAAQLDVHEYETVNSKGETVWIELRVSPLKDHTGVVIGALELAIPITERKKTEDKLLANSLYSRSLIEASLDPLVTISIEGKVTDVNKATEDVTGYTRQELIGSDFSDYFTEPKEALEGYQKVITEGLVKDYPLAIRHKSGRITNVLYNATVNRNSQGEIEGVFAAARDITELKKAEDKLQNALTETQIREKEVSAFLASTKAVLINSDYAVAAREIFDNCKKLIGATAGYVALLSDDGSENKVLFLDAGGFSCTVDPSLPMPIRGLRETAYRTCKVVYENDFSKSHWMQLMPNGHVHLGNVMFVPLVIGGKAVGLMGLANKPSDFNEHDVLIASGFGEYAAIALNNSWKMVSIENQQKNLETLNEKLRVVGSLARHDVGNKLMVIKSNLYLLKKQIGDNPKVAKYFEGIDSALHFSDKIFEYSRFYEKIGSEKLSKMNVFECFNQAVVLIPNLNNVKVVHECEGFVVVADSMLKQLFYNFIDNSLKHGEKVTQISLRYIENADGLKLIYEDNGVGIPEANKSKLFEAGFSTGKGSGFGLFLIKKMMDVYGWKIEENGEPGTGAKFTITIPRLDKNGKENYQIVPRALNSFSLK